MKPLKTWYVLHSIYVGLEPEFETAAAAFQKDNNMQYI